MALRVLRCKVGALGFRIQSRGGVRATECKFWFCGFELPRQFNFAMRLQQRLKGIGKA